MEAADVVQLYVRKKFASCVLPSKLLKGFCKVNLKVNEEKKVIFEIPSEILAFTDENLKLKIEEGIYEIMVGNSSEDIKFKDEIEIKGNKFLKKKGIFFSSCKIK
jgi:beta-glucosidase